MPDSNAADHKYSFTGHESFPFRFTWLAKGVRAAASNPAIFVSGDAPVTLGVGKNMVQSIRHWCLALNLIKSDGRTGHCEVTELGKQLTGPDGWDPYLEDVGTLWLLHWLLARGGERASTWYLAFTRFSASVFSRDQLAGWIHDLVRDVPTVRATPVSLRRDVEVFVRCYVPVNPTRDLGREDTFDCPLVELGLIEEIERGLFRFVRGAQPSLPAEVLVYSLIDYWNSRFPGRHSISFEALQYGPGGPGAAFKLTESAMAERLEQLPEWTGFVYDETAGMRVLRWKGMGRGDPWDGMPLEVLARYYAGQSEVTRP